MKRCTITAKVSVLYCTQVIQINDYFEYSTISEGSLTPGIFKSEHREPTSQKWTLDKFSNIMKYEAQIA